MFGGLVGSVYGLVIVLAPLIILGVLAVIAYSVYKRAYMVTLSFDAGIALASVLVSGALYILALAVFMLAHAINLQASQNVTCYYQCQP